MIKPALNYNDNEWVNLIGRYIMNMGAIEMTSRLIIARIHNTDKIAIFNEDLESRIKYIKAKYPRNNKARHSMAMKLFSVIERHIGFRNIIAHSPIVLSGDETGPKSVIGILNLKPKQKDLLAEIIKLDEIRGRVNESAALGTRLLEISNDFPVIGADELGTSRS